MLQPANHLQHLQMKFTADVVSNTNVFYCENKVKVRLVLTDVH